jgi:hypothetical protein
MRNFAKRLSEVKNIVLEDIYDAARSKSFVKKLNLTAQQKDICEQLKQDGVALVKDFYPREACEAVKRQLDGYIQESPGDKDFESGAYLRYYDFMDYDQGVRRIHHVEKEIPKLVDYRHNKFVLDIAGAYFGKPMFSQILIFQHNVVTDGTNRYHHVDQFGKQFKAFLYLEDVDINKGPFSYIKGSHREHYIRIKKQIIGNKIGSPTSFYEEDVKEILDRETAFCGSAGTLILADVRGIHRGLPQKTSSRSILMNYIYPTPGDRFPDK